MIEAEDRVNREFYVAPIYNRLIAAGAADLHQSGRRGLGAGHTGGFGLFPRVF